MFESEEELFERILHHIANALRWLLRPFMFKSKELPIPNLLSYLAKGDRVEDTKGNRGSVFRVYKEIKTGKIAGCIVYWDYPTDDSGKASSHLSPLLPADDLGKYFNPDIRKIQK